MKNITCRIALVAAAVFMITGIAYAVPEASNVKMTQREDSRILDITYDLIGQAAIITLGIETNGVAIPDSTVTELLGDVSTVIQPGTGKSIVWNAGADWPENLTQVAKAKITAWSTNAPPQVMVINLSKGTAATEADPYPVYYYTSLDALPGGGLNNDVYKTEMLVMNKISMGSYSMGDETRNGVSVFVTLTQDFYMGVYEVTQKQWFKVTGGNPSSAAHNSVHPAEAMSYDHIRGADLGSGWPTNHSVDASSFIGRMRVKTGLPEFDLPTEAQWEYACRAGTITYFNDGIDGSTTNQLNELGWWEGNVGEKWTYPVGQKVPNAWDLYDMHGNVAEWCLDWYGVSLPLAGGDDPKGPVSGTARVIRGGSFQRSAEKCGSAYRFQGWYAPGSVTWALGFRLVRTLPSL